MSVTHGLLANRNGHLDFGMRVGSRDGVQDFKIKRDVPHSDQGFHRDNCLTSGLQCDDVCGRLKREFRQVSEHKIGI